MARLQVAAIWAWLAAYAIAVCLGVGGFAYGLIWMAAMVIG